MRGPTGVSRPKSDPLWHFEGAKRGQGQRSDGRMPAKFYRGAPGPLHLPAIGWDSRSQVTRWFVVIHRCVLCRRSNRDPAVLFPLHGPSIVPSGQKV